MAIVKQCAQQPRARRARAATLARPSACRPLETKRADPAWDCAAPWSTILYSFLPPGWSPAYKFTVFEDAFLVLFVELDIRGIPVREDDGFHLARPISAPRATAGLAPTADTVRAPGLPAFELVWPLKMDGEFTRQVACVFAQSARQNRPNKRKECEMQVSELASEVGFKLCRLSFNP
jgi:hypothetical protein